MRSPYKLVDVPDGWVGWLRGRIVANPPLVAPLSGRACAYYHLMAKDDDDHAAVGVEASTTPIVIDDGTARAVVEPDAAFVHVVYDVLERVRDGALLTRLGVEGPYLLREGVLEPGQWISIHGQCTRDVDRDPRRVSDYRSGPPTLLRIGRGARVQLWVSEVD